MRLLSTSLAFAVTFVGLFAGLFGGFSYLAISDDNQDTIVEQLKIPNSALIAGLAKILRTQPQEPSEALTK